MSTGVVAAGHPLTAAAGAEILRGGADGLTKAAYDGTDAVVEGHL